MGTHPNACRCQFVTLPFIGSESPEGMEAPEEECWDQDDTVDQIFKYQVN